MSITVVFTHTIGSYDDIHDNALETRIIFRATLGVPDVPNPTFIDVVKPLSKCFIEFWRVVYAGNTLSWQDIVPPSANKGIIYLMAPVGHWSSADYAKNFPLFALPHVDWVRSKQ